MDPQQICISAAAGSLERFKRPLIQLHKENTKTDQESYLQTTLNINYKLTGDYQAHTRLNAKLNLKRDNISTRGSALSKFARKPFVDFRAEVSFEEQDSGSKSTEDTEGKVHQSIR